MTSDASGWRTRRGRRPYGHDTRAALLDAAREVFSQRGYAAATVRDIASRAQVDAAMIGYWFGSKRQLYVHAVLEVPFDHEAVVDDLVAGDHDTLGERIVRRFVTVWDTTSGGRFAALARSLASHDAAASALRDFLIERLLSQVMAAINADQPALRASLCASQLIGLGMVRYVTEYRSPSSASGFRRRQPATNRREGRIQQQGVSAAAYRSSYTSDHPHRTARRLAKDSQDARSCRWILWIQGIAGRVVAEADE